MDDADVGPGSATTEGESDDKASAEDGMVMGAEWRWCVVGL